MTTQQWTNDILGDDFEQTTIELGIDPDGETDVVTTVVRHTPSTQHRTALLFIHGMTDYFFQAHVAEFFADTYATYAVDLRKCGRSWRPGQRWHHTTDMAHYFPDLTAALECVLADDIDSVVVVAHSTGGLIAPLWLNDLQQTRPDLAQHIPALVLNSPWLGMMIPDTAEKLMRPVVRTLGRLRPNMKMPKDGLTAYGQSIHASVHGEWDFNLKFKPIEGNEKTFSWLKAVVEGQDAIHAGTVECFMPVLVLCSTSSWLGKPYSAATDAADAVLDVRDIQKWAPSLGADVTVEPIAGARHDVFLSQQKAREAALNTTRAWLEKKV